MTYVVWIDSDQAKLFKLAVGKVEQQTVKREGGKHAGTADPQHLKNEERYFHEVARSLDNAKELLLVGPGLAKTHFATHLQKHHHQNLAKRIVGFETVDHPSENEILAIARKFFRSYDLFQSKR